MTSARSAFVRPAFRFLARTALLSVLPSAAALAQSTPTPAPDSVRAVAERNIFNPSRTPRGGGADAAPSAPPSPAAEILTLVGILDDGGRRRAFFDGSTAALRQTLPPGGSVAGVTVSDLTLQHASLATDGQTFVIPVGSSLSREPGGAWRAAPEARAAAAASAEPPAANLTPSAPSPSDSSDALRRLKERRRKQLKE